MMNLSDLSQFKALYLEDEVLIAMDGEEILRSMGIGEVHVAYSIDDAVKAAKDNRFDFALLDVNLGEGQSSAALAEQLMKQGTMVVFASGYNPTEGPVSNLGAPLIMKPFDEGVLRAAFMDALARREKDATA